MEDLKAVLFYLLGLAGLIVASILFTGQAEVVVNELSTVTPIKAGQSDCVPTAMTIAYIYTPNSPYTTTLAPPDLKGDRLIVSGTVYSADRVTPLPGALLEVWQADAYGQFERLRAQMQTDANGRYEFTTIKPGHYKVDCQFLPAHIHYRVSYLDSQPLLTSLFFAGDPYLAHIPPVKQAHIKSLTADVGSDGPVLHTTFDLILSVNSGGEG